MTDTESDLAAIRARCDAATEGPWEYAPEHLAVTVELGELSISAVARFDCLDCLDGETEAECDARNAANAEFAAHARTDLPALLDLSERQAAEIEQLRAGLCEGREAVTEANVRVLRANAVVNEAKAAMQHQDADLLEARAEIERLRAAAGRAAESLDALIYDSRDPGTEALGARWELRHALGGANHGPLPTTEDYRVVLRDETAVDEPSGGWQQIGSTVPTLAAAIEQRATRRRYHPEWPEMRVWRRQDVWSVAAVEDRDAEPVLCVDAHAVLGRICDRPGGHPGLHSGRSDSGEWAQW